jgi:hypothetical protein
VTISFHLHLVPKFPEYYSYTYTVPYFIVGFGVKLSYFFFFWFCISVKKLNYVSGFVVRMLLEAKPIKVLSEPIVLLKLN